jgi:hypothetical protein
MTVIATPSEVYEFTELAIRRCREQGYDDVAQQLDAAMHLGSSGLEILGAIKTTFIAHAEPLETVVDKGKMQEILRYVDKAFGTE